MGIEGGDKEVLSPVGERIFDKIDALGDDIQEMARDIRQLLQYVLIIGALNGTITVGKIVDSAVSFDSGDKAVVGVETNESRKGDFDSRQDKSSTGKPTY